MHLRDLAVAIATVLLLAWADTSDNEDGFAIERLSGGSFQEIARVGSNVQSYKDDAAAEGCYRVRAFNAFGYSDYSNTACLLKPPVSLSIK